MKEQSIKFIIDEIRGISFEISATVTVDEKNKVHESNLKIRADKQPTTEQLMRLSLIGGLLSTEASLSAIELIESKPTKSK